MNGNSSKQVLLSVLGIAVLVVAVVGVSFAFFTYSRTGQTTNTLTAGNIFFQFTDSDEIHLEDQFPMTDARGEALSTSTTGETLTFHVKGFSTNDGNTGNRIPISYTIYALKTGTTPTYTYDDNGTERTAERTRLHDTGIKLNLSGPAVDGTNYTNNYSTSSFVSTTDNDAIETATTSNGKGLQLATGKITSGTASQPQDDVYTLRMWISSDVSANNGTGVKIDNVTGGTSTTDNIYTQEDFAHCYYSLKIRVDAEYNR